MIYAAGQVIIKNPGANSRVPQGLRLDEIIPIKEELFYKGKVFISPA
jgi:hypothetical protein